MQQHDEVVNCVSYDNTVWPAGRALRSRLAGNDQVA